MEPSQLPESLKTAITAKCGSIVSLSIVWESSAQKALASGASPETVVSILAVMQSSRNFHALLAGLAEEQQSLDVFLRDFCALVDDSSFDFEAWMASYELVQRNLTEHGRSATPGSITGYIQCAAEFGDSLENRDSLPEIISGMLEQYGFEGQEGCGTSLGS